MNARFLSDPPQLQRVRNATVPHGLHKLMTRFRAECALTELPGLQKQLADLEASIGQMPVNSFERSAAESDRNRMLPFVRRGEDNANGLLHSIFNESASYAVLRDDVRNLKAALIAECDRAESVVKSALAKAGFSSDAAIVLPTITAPLTDFLTRHVEPALGSLDGIIDSQEIDAPPARPFVDPVSLSWLLAGCSIWRVAN